MPNTETKQPVVATGKLTQEQQNILQTVQQNDYTSEELEEVFAFLNKPNLQDFVYSIDMHIADYLSSVEQVSNIELTGLYNLFSFNRALASIADKF